MLLLLQVFLLSLLAKLLLSKKVSLPSNTKHSKFKPVGDASMRARNGAQESKRTTRADAAIKEQLEIYFLF